MTFFAFVLILIYLRFLDFFSRFLLFPIFHPTLILDCGNPNILIRVSIRKWDRYLSSRLKFVPYPEQKVSNLVDHADIEFLYILRFQDAALSEVGHPNKTKPVSSGYWN